MEFTLLTHCPKPPASRGVRAHSSINLGNRHREAVRAIGCRPDGAHHDVKKRALSVWNASPEPTGARCQNFNSYVTGPVETPQHVASGMRQIGPAHKALTNMERAFFQGL